MTLHGWDPTTRSWATGLAGMPAKLDAADTPLALYQFEGVKTDSSGNGLTLTTGAGTDKWVSWAGLTGIYTDSSHYLYSSAAALALTGAASAIVLGAHYTNMGTAHNVVSWAGNGETEALNTLYAIGCATTGMQFDSEYAAGVNASLTTNLQIAPNYLHVMGFTRSAGGLVKVWLDGAKIGESSLTVPTGGSSGQFRIAANAATTYYPWLVFSLGIYASELAEARMAAKMRACLGVL